MKLLFWCSLEALFYIYIGYPLLVWVLARVCGRVPIRRRGIPAVSLLIPAYNEDAHIEQKLRNSLALDYPKARLEIVVASDGSTDRTNAMVERFRSQGVRLLAMQDHIGKAAMLGGRVPVMRGEVGVFSDVSSE